MVKEFIAHSADPEGMKDAVTANYALPGFVQPMDVANASAFLLSDEARYITGHSLPVDAGSLCRMANARDHTNVK
jgi:NAD(P)-dependent dehydrogenase (short-subunit alcohol dehydrogenase family)